jgi:hypothetical protein
MDLALRVTLSSVVSKGLRDHKGNKDLRVTLDHRGLRVSKAKLVSTALMALMVSTVKMAVTE